MSLQVWLPFNGNAENHGLYNVTPTSTAWSSNSSGKIGLCAKLSTSSNFNTLLPISAWDYSEKSITFSLWVKINQAELNAVTSTKSYTSTNKTAGGTLIGRHSYKGLALRWQTNNIYSSGSLSSVVVYMAARDNASHSYATTSVNIAWDQWTHVAGIFNRDLSRLELYVNGNLSYTSAINVSYFTSAALQNSNVLLNVAEWDVGNGHGVCAPWYVNDVRIYDHALSEKEVKELAKGLVLHYKLDSLINKNLIANSALNGSWAYPSSSYSDKYSPITLEVPSGSVYTLSFDAKSTVNGDKIRTHYYSPNTTTTCISSQGITRTASDGYMSFSLSTLWERYWVIYNQSSTTAVKHIICPRLVSGEGTGTVSVRNVKFEAGAVATPWIPSEIGEILVVHDSSGFGYNGALANIVLSKDTARYSNSFMLNGSSSYIKTESKDWMVSGSTELTINFWAKTSNWTSGRMISCTESGGFNIEPGNSGYLRFPVNAYTNADKTSHVYIYDSSELQISAMPVNQWVMITCVYNAATGTKTYINGVLHHTYSRVTYGLYYNTNARFFIGCEANTASPSGPYFNGSISDFRMYSTALSAEDILELYQTSASIDKAGNIYTRELIE